MFARSVFRIFSSSRCFCSNPIRKPKPTLQQLRKERVVDNTEQQNALHVASRVKELTDAYNEGKIKDDTQFCEVMEECSKHQQFHHVLELWSLLCNSKRVFPSKKAADIIIAVIEKRDKLQRAEQSIQHIRRDGGPISSSELEARRKEIEREYEEPAEEDADGADDEEVLAMLRKDARESMLADTPDLDEAVDEMDEDELFRSLTMKMGPAQRPKR